MGVSTANLGIASFPRPLLVNRLGKWKAPIAPGRGGSILESFSGEESNVRLHFSHLSPAHVSLVGPDQQDGPAYRREEALRSKRVVLVRARDKQHQTVAT